MDDDKEMQVALFKFGLISQLLHVKEGDDLSAMINKLSEGEYQIPFTRKTKISAKSIKRYLETYKQQKFEGLKRKERNDKNKPKVLSDALFKLVLDLKRENPRRSVRHIIEIIKRDPLYANEKITERTLSRILKNNDLTRKTLIPQKIRRSFEMEHINDLWQTDCMDGLFIKKEKKKTHLIAFIDDYSRLITHAQFYFDEKLPR